MCSLWAVQGVLVKGMEMVDWSLAIGHSVSATV